MQVQSIQEFASRDSVAVLEHLLERAKQGDIQGLALCARPVKGPEEIVFTGIYRRSPGKGVNASMRMSWRLTQLQDEQDALEFQQSQY